MTVSLFVQYETLFQKFSIVIPSSTCAYTRYIHIQYEVMRKGYGRLNVPLHACITPAFNRISPNKENRPGKYCAQIFITILRYIYNERVYLVDHKQLLLLHFDPFLPSSSCISEGGGKCTLYHTLIKPFPNISQ